MFVEIVDHWQNGYIGSPFKAIPLVSSSQSDEPTLEEAMSAGLEKVELWRSELEDEFCLLEETNTCTLDSNSKLQLLPTLVFQNLKIFPVVHSNVIIQNLLPEGISKLLVKTFLRHITLGSHIVVYDRFGALHGLKSRV